MRTHAHSQRGDVRQTSTPNADRAKLSPCELVPAGADRTTVGACADDRAGGGGGRRIGEADGIADGLAGSGWGVDRLRVVRVGGLLHT